MSDVTKVRVRALDHLRPPEPPAVDVGLCEKRAEGGEGRREGGGKEERTIFLSS